MNGLTFGQASHGARIAQSTGAVGSRFDNPTRLHSTLGMSFLIEYDADHEAGDPTASRA